MIIVDILVVLILVYSAYVGSRRGGMLVLLELISFLAATVMAFSFYEVVGKFVKQLTGVPLSLSNIVAFASIWVSAELLLAVIMRFGIIRNFHSLFQLNNFAIISGAVLNCAKNMVFLALIINVFASLPLDDQTKRIVTGAYIPHGVLLISGGLQPTLAGTIGRDLGESLNFFSVTTTAENDKKILLGFTTTKGVIDENAERRMLVLINKERAANRLDPLTLNVRATEVARNYSKRMLAEGFFAHIDPDGHTPFDRMRAGGVKFGSAGENLALAPTLELAHQGLMNSPGHRANILSEDYQTVGIGIIDAGIYGLMVTQNFTD